MTMTGKVKFFNRDKGFGFITPDEGKHDVFIHISVLEAAGIGELPENQRVGFETSHDTRGRGLRAIKLIILDDEPAQAE